MKVLTITNLFPNNMQPERGVFNKQQLGILGKLCELQVIAPIPWIPKRLAWGARSLYCDVVKEEKIMEIPVLHPRYFVTPKIGRSFYGWFYFLGIRNVIKRIHKTFKFDVVFATWAYPDAFAASIIARLYKKPLVIKVHGSDINVLTKYVLRRNMIKSAFKQAHGIIVVTEDLKRKIVELGIDKEKVFVVPNGVDGEMFKSLRRDHCLKTLELEPDKKHVVFIGNLTPIKGINYLIESAKDLPDDVQVSIIGAGDQRKELQRQIKKLVISERVKLYGKRTHHEIPLWMNAADVFCLPSINEGCPNVILEALACGTPVVASDVGGVSEILSQANLGILVDAQDSKKLSEALKEALSRSWSHSSIEQYVSRFNWNQGVLEIRDILESSIKGDQDNTSETPLNILYHHRTQGTGAEGVHISHVIKGLRGLGHNIDVVSPTNNDSVRTAGNNPFAEKKGFKQKAMGALSRYLPQALFEILEMFYNISARTKLKSVLNSQKVNFLYERQAFFLFAGAKLSEKYKIPYIVEVNEIAGEDRVRKQVFVRLAKKIERYVFQRADAIVVVSEFLKTKIAEQGIDKNKIHVIPNGVDETLFNPALSNGHLREKLSVAQDTVVIGFIGWFVAWHKLELLIDVFSDLAKVENVVLMLVGDGHLKNSLLTRMKKRDVVGSVILPGAVQYDEVPEYISMMDICVIPASNEYRSPIKLFEYMAMGKAVVAPKFRSIESIVEDKKEGILFMPDNREELQHALIQLIDNRSKREDMGKKAREKVLANHLWAHNAQRVIDLYERIV